MRKLTIFTSFFFVLTACGTDNPSLIESRQDATSARISWHASLTDEERALLCNVYLTTEYEEIIAAFIDQGMTPNEADEFYNVLNEEC